MDIMVYVFGAISVVLGLVTAVLYTKGKAGTAFFTKMSASTAFLIAGICALSIKMVDDEIGAMIVVAMIFSMWGDYFLARKEMSPKGGHNFAYGVYSFAVSQILFIVAFLVMAGDFCYYLLFLLLLSAIPLVVGKLTHMLTFRKGELVLSLVYGTLLCATLATTANAYMSLGDDSSLVAMIASISFLVSDFSLGLYYFSSLKGKKYFNYPIMIFYFLAEALYAVAIII